MAEPSTLPESHQLVIRGIEAVEGTKGQLGAVEKSIDTMEQTVRSSAEVARRAGDALERIAKAEEERNRMAGEAVKRRDDLLSRMFASPPMQFMLILVLAGLAQVLGLRWVVDNYLPRATVPVAAPTSEATP